MTTDDDVQAAEKAAVAAKEAAKKAEADAKAAKKRAAVPQVVLPPMPSSGDGRAKTKDKGDWSML